MSRAEQSSASGKARDATGLVATALGSPLAVVLASAGMSGAGAQEMPGGNGPSGAAGEPGSQRKMISLVGPQDNLTVSFDEELRRRLAAGQLTP